MLWGLWTPLLVPPVFISLLFTQGSFLRTKMQPKLFCNQHRPKEAPLCQGSTSCVDIEAQGMWTEEVLEEWVPWCPQLPRAKAWLPPALPHGLWTGRAGLPSPPGLCSRAILADTWPALEVLRRPTQSQVDCTPETVQAEGFQTPLGTSRGKGRPPGSVEVRVLRMHSDPEQ